MDDVLIRFIFLNLILYRMNNWNYDNLVLFVVNTRIDDNIIKHLPDEIKNCEFFRLCVSIETLKDMLRVVNNEPTDIDSIDCLESTLGICND